MLSLVLGMLTRSRIIFAVGSVVLLGLTGTISYFKGSSNAKYDCINDRAAEILKGERMYEEQKYKVQRLPVTDIDLMLIKWMRD